MDAPQPKNVFLEREFMSHDSDGNITQIKLTISEPHLIDLHRWRCTFQITGIGNENLRAIDGVDAIDALILGLRMADTLLKYYSKREKRKITWLGNDDLGLLRKKDDLE